MLPPVLATLESVLVVTDFITSLMALLAEPDIKFLNCSGVATVSPLCSLATMSFGSVGDPVSPKVPWARPFGGLPRLGAPPLDASTSLAVLGSTVPVMPVVKSLGSLAARASDSACVLLFPNARSNVVLTASIFSGVFPKS